MTKVEFIKKWSEKVKKETDMAFTDKNARIMFDTFVNELIAELKAKGETVLSGFGQFKIRKRASRTGRNPRTGEPVKIPERKGIAFKASEVLKREFE